MLFYAKIDERHGFDKKECISSMILILNRKRLVKYILNH